MKEYLKQNALKRASTFHHTYKKKSPLKKKEKHNINNKNKINKEEIDNVHKLLEMRMKRGKTCYDLSKFKKVKDVRMNNIKIYKNEITEIPKFNRYNSALFNGEDNFN